MFNLLISSDPASWNEGSYQYDKNRVAIEYTADEISERYKFFTEEAIEELKEFPTLFVTENETTPSRVGYITNIRVRSSSLAIEFEFDPIFPELPMGTIKNLKDDIDLGRLELFRTHWAIKDEGLFDILLRKELITQEQIDASQAQRRASFPDPEPAHSETGGFNTSQVFIVHGHDEIAKSIVANFVSDLGLEPIILHRQASSGRTIIEKLEHYSNVGFAIILYTPCDVGAKAGELISSYRARQNVVFEHGYLIGKIGRSRITAIVKGQVETPNDISGVVYIAMDENENWKEEIKTEMRSSGYQISNERI